jgi:hypothetical protein
MSAEFAISLFLICAASMVSTYRLGIKEERARWVRRMDRWQRRQAILDGRIREEEERREWEGMEE